MKNVHAQGEEEEKLDPFALFDFLASLEDRFIGEVCVNTLIVVSIASRKSIRYLCCFSSSRLEVILREYLSIV